MHSKAGSGHLAQGGQGEQGLDLGQVLESGHLGQTGGTISDFKIYKSSSPSAICDLGIPGGKADVVSLDVTLESKDSFSVYPKLASIKTPNKIAINNVLFSLILNII